MTITASRAAEIALRHGVAAEVAVAILREVWLTVVPDFAGREARLARSPAHSC